MATKDQNKQPTIGAGQQSVDAREHVADDAAEDDQRHAIADAILGDEITHPQGDHSCLRPERQQRGRQQRINTEAELGQHRSAAAKTARHHNCLAITLQNRQGDGEVERVLIDFLSPGIAILGDFFQSWDDRNQQLQDNRGGNVRIDAHRHHREVG